ncbi:MAG: hypothetical protein KDD40_11050 [Bdellovibrionales bacterium]|nr:hypothetical protein [Bdellovibrionales bacterium]
MKTVKTILVLSLLAAPSVVLAKGACALSSHGRFAKTSFKKEDGNKNHSVTPKRSVSKRKAR